MLDKIHKNGFPWMKKGRWYEFFIENDNGAYKLTLSDLEGCAIAANNLKFPDGYHILQYVCDVNSDADAVVTNQQSIKIYADGKQACNLPALTSFDWCKVYVFAYLGD